MTNAAVRRIMDEPPWDSQRSESEFGVSEHWYYGSFQLSFSDGRLDGKSRF